MRLRWPVWGRRAARRSASVESVASVKRPRGRNPSRPRVLRAVAAAYAAQGGSTTRASEEMARVWRARESGPLWMDRHMGQWPEAAPSARVLWAARAAPNSGREPAEVWAEALGAWLGAPEQERATPAVCRAADARRTQAWQAIDTTLGHLRAS